MSEPGDAAPTIGTDSLGPSAGAMLRAARERRGVHIAALAAAIKVPQRKLEALEADRYDELVDMTFTRALAQSVCRSLKVDVQPVLDRLPHAGPSPKLAQVGGGINAPFRERPGREEPSDWGWARRPVVWGTALVLLGALALALLPERWLDRGVRTRVPAASAPAATATEPASGVTLSPVLVTTPAPVAMAASEAAPVVGVPPDAVALAIKASAETWIEVQDAGGQVLLQRKLAAGENALAEGARPLRVTIGNAAATQLTVGGKPLELGPHTVANVARLQVD
jgi:cytoskeleton protein RodZ